MGWPLSAALGQRASTGGGRTVVPDTLHGSCPVVPRRAGQLTCTLHRGHGQVPHALTRWNVPASLVSPPVPTLTCPRSSLGCAGLWPPRDRARPVGCAVLAGSHPPCRITRYSHCWWLAGRCRMCWLVGYSRPDFGLVWVGWGVVAVRSVLHSPGVAVPWWRHSPVGLGRCRSDRPTFFWPRWWLGRVACLYLPDTPQLCGP
jgi:hypothetical protein